MSAPAKNSKLDELIRTLDEACSDADGCSCCHGVKTVLEEVVRSGQEFIPENMMRPAPDRYARRLLHRDPKGRYTVLVMVWGPGQGTALHDHAGMWCVECVYRGKIQVDSYSLEGLEEDIPAKFTKELSVFAGVGEAGALIPPFDYHTIANALSEPSVTLHVYGGEMTWCHAFVPIEGGYRKERRELSYTD